MSTNVFRNIPGQYIDITEPAGMSAEVNVTINATLTPHDAFQLADPSHGSGHRRPQRERPDHRTGRLPEGDVMNPILYRINALAFISDIASLDEVKDVNPNAYPHLFKDGRFWRIRLRPNAELFLTGSGLVIP